MHSVSGIINEGEILVPCPECGKELEFVDQYSQWYCRACRRYPVWPTPPFYPPYGYPYPPPQGTGIEDRKVIMIIIIVVILIVVIPIIFSAILYVWVMNLAEMGEEVVEFPTLKIELMTDTKENNYLKIEHHGGYPINWTDYQIFITDVTASSNSVALHNLTGEQGFGEIVIFTNNGSFEGGYIVGFGDLVMSIGQQYYIKIYDAVDQQLVLRKEVSCVAY